MVRTANQKIAGTSGLVALERSNTMLILLWLFGRLVGVHSITEAAMLRFSSIFSPEVYPIVNMSILLKQDM